MNTKGQSYLIVAFILVTLMVTVAFVSRTTVYPRVEGDFLGENIEKELPLTYTAGIYQDDLNAILTEMSNEFREFSAAKGFDLKLVFAATEIRGVAAFITLGNFWGSECTYYNSRIGPLTLADGETITRPRAVFHSDFDLYFCGELLDLTEDFDYYANVSREGEVVVVEG